MNKIAITMGDPKGVGPEIVAAIASDFKRTHTSSITIFGDPSILKAAAETIHCTPIETWSCEIVAVSNDPDFRHWDDAQCGRLSRDYVTNAVEFCQVSGATLVTAPINKHRWRLASGKSTGHTEYLAHLTQTTDVGMMMACPQLRTVPVTIHTPLQQVSKNITVEKIIKCSILTNIFLKKHFKIKSPRLALTGLNPHAGEQGDLGQEEITTIIPAIAQLRQMGLDVSGPLPADGLFASLVAGQVQYDTVICMYHDQAMIPVKALDFQNTVNITMGLPFIRTSPDHGTAEDIAWQGRANTQHMMAALEMALALNRKE